MSDTTLSVLSIKLEAQQSKLDRDLDQAESKAKRSGQKMEGSLSLSNAASGLVKVFAALGTIESGFKAITGVVQALDGDLSGALDTIETMPFGIGPAIAAARDFFEVISGSRKEAERLAAEWAKVTSQIREAESLVDKLKISQEAEDENNFDALNKQSAKINELNRQYTELIQELKNETATDPLPPDLADRLKDIVPDAKTAGDAIEQLREKVQEAFGAGMRGFFDVGKDVLGSGEQFERQQRIESLQSRGTEGEADLELRLLQAYYAEQDALAKASNDVERRAIENLHKFRIGLIEDERRARRQAEEDARRNFLQNWERDYARGLEKQNRELERAAKARQAEADQAERDRFVEGKGFSAEEFMRTNFAGGTAEQQKVNDPEAVNELQEVNQNLLDVIRAVNKQVAALV